MLNLKLELIDMSNLEEEIRFHPGPQGATSYFYLREEGHSHADARVTLICFGHLKNRLASLEAAKSPIDPRQVLLIGLPATFLAHLGEADIDVLEAWHYMVAQRAASLGKKAARPRCDADSEMEQAKRLARILASVSGGRPQPMDLLRELLELIQAHGAKAVGLLEEWSGTFGFSEKGQYIIVENRENMRRRRGLQEG